MASLSLDDLRRQIDLPPAERLVVIERSADVIGGLTVFRGTRVPARALLDYLAAEDGLTMFIDDFPSVERHQAIALLELVRELIPM
jgi:uncharacterized protein (DUF433 family)